MRFSHPRLGLSGRVRANGAETQDRPASIEDRGRVYIELLLVAIVVFFAMGRITPWEIRAASAMQVIGQQVARAPAPFEAISVQAPATPLPDAGPAQSAKAAEKPEPKLAMGSRERER